MLERVEDFPDQPAAPGPSLELVPQPEPEYMPMSRTRFLANTAMVAAFSGAALLSVYAENDNITNHWSEPAKTIGNSDGHLVLGAAGVLTVLAVEFIRKKEFRDQALAGLTAAGVAAWDIAGETARTAMTGFKYNPLKSSEIPESTRDLIFAGIGGLAAALLNIRNRKP